MCVCNQGYTGDLCDKIDCGILENCNKKGKIFIYKGKCVKDNTAKKAVCNCTTGGWIGDKCQTITCDTYKACTGNSF